MSTGDAWGSERRADVTLDSRDVGQSIVKLEHCAGKPCVGSEILYENE